jgi:hypothetical protein
MTLAELDIWLNQAFELTKAGDWKMLTIGQGVAMLIIHISPVIVISLFSNGELDSGSGCILLIISVLFLLRLIVFYVYNNEKQNAESECERCKGDGFVDMYDLIDLGKPTFKGKDGSDYYFQPGSCMKCSE